MKVLGWTREFRVRRGRYGVPSGLPGARYAVCYQGSSPLTSPRPCRRLLPISQTETLRLRGAVTGSSTEITTAEGHSQNPQGSSGQPPAWTPPSVNCSTSLLLRGGVAGGGGGGGRPLGRKCQVRPESGEKGQAADLENWAPGDACHSLAQPPTLTWPSLSLSLFLSKVGEDSQLIVEPFLHEVRIYQQGNRRYRLTAAEEKDYGRECWPGVRPPASAWL